MKPFGISLQADETSNDWAPVKEALAPWLEQAAVVLTPNDLYALYYLEGYDVAVNPNLLSEMPDDAEFSLDPRTGRPVIATAASLRLLIDCYPEGLYVADEKTYPLPWAGSEELNETIRSEMTPIDFRTNGAFSRFDGSTPSSEQPAECASLVRAIKPAASAE